MFKVKSNLKPTGDQPQAIEKLSRNFRLGAKAQVLLGVTGSGKTFTIAKVIEQLQKPTLVISPNKTLAAQLYQEFREFFPENAVHYFVSYYDYYQPEAYIPATDTYIEKDAKINEQLDQLRHAAVQDLLVRDDIIIVASVSCIYNIGSPKAYEQVSLEIKPGKAIKRRDFIAHLIGLQYARNDIEPRPGSFRVRGNIIEIYLATARNVIEVEFSENKISRIANKCPGFSGEKTGLPYLKLFPAQFWITPKNHLDIAIENIKLELQESLKELKAKNKLLEIQRLSQKTNYDLEMLKESGYCHGIENYSRHLEFRKPGSPPYTLMDYFGSKSFLTVIDESHLSLPQIRGMANQDRARKEILIDHGFRLPSAIDNRPLTFREFNEKVGPLIYASATPGNYEVEKTGARLITEQLIRPTGLLEPSVEIRTTRKQTLNLINEIEKRSKKKQRTLVITLTKRLAEALSEYLVERGIKARYLHSEIKTLERPEILRDLRLGKYDVLVGINLLREGLDLPEVTLVAILDADKEGFLRDDTTLIQTMGRAARHPEGHVILYADKMTGAMKIAIDEVSRRRTVQEKYNKINKVRPQPVVKAIREWAFYKPQGFGDWLSLMELQDLKALKEKMKNAAKNLDFEKAAEIRDVIQRLASQKEKPRTLA